jgi:hypothetical protein
VEPLALSADEQGEACRLMAAIGCRSDLLEKGPQALVSDWEAFVMRCEAGYTGSYGDFLQDISVRTILARLLLRLPRSIRVKVEPAILELDYRYRAVPRKSDDFLLDPRLQARHPPETCFWLYGLPVSSRLR